MRFKVAAGNQTEEGRALWSKVRELIMSAPFGRKALAPQA